MHSITDRPGLQSEHLHSTHAATLNMRCPQPQLRCLLVFNRHGTPCECRAIPGNDIGAAGCPPWWPASRLPPKASERDGRGGGVVKLGQPGGPTRLRSGRGGSASSSTAFMILQGAFPTEIPVTTGRLVLHLCLGPCNRRLGLGPSGPVFAQSRVRWSTGSADWMSIEVTTRSFAGKRNASLTFPSGNGEREPR